MRESVVFGNEFGEQGNGKRCRIAGGRNKPDMAAQTRDLFQGDAACLQGIKPCAMCAPTADGAVVECRERKRLWQQILFPITPVKQEHDSGPVIGRGQW